MAISIDYAPLFGTSGRSGANVIEILHGSLSPVSPYGPVRTLLLVERNKVCKAPTRARQPQVERGISAFKMMVAPAKDPKKLIRSPAVIKVLSTASEYGS